MNTKPTCTCHDTFGICGLPATHRYKVLPNGDWYYLCFEHWGMTAIARVVDKDACYTKTCEKLSDDVKGLMDEA